MTDLQITQVTERLTQVCFPPLSLRTLLMALFDSLQRCEAAFPTSEKMIKQCKKKNKKKKLDIYLIKINIYIYRDIYIINIDLNYSP